jgi:hypothetical protein
VRISESTLILCKWKNYCIFRYKLKMVEPEYCNLLLALGEAIHLSGRNISHWKYKANTENLLSGLSNCSHREVLLYWCLIWAEHGQPVECPTNHNWPETMSHRGTGVHPAENMGSVTADSHLCCLYYGIQYLWARFDSVTEEWTE